MSNRRFIVVMLFLISGVLYCLDIQALEVQQSSTNNVQSIDDEADDTVNFVVRFGQGGFRDNRSPENQLGGGQLALDIKPWDLPWVLSITTEYYTNSPDPSHAYEIESLYAVNVLYAQQTASNQKLNYFIGGGIGRLDVPMEESNPDKTRSGNLLNLEAGVNYLLYRKFGVYGVIKYLRAQKSVNDQKVIDFNEAIVLLGISYSFGF